MLCSISGQPPQEPIVSTKSGYVFEKNLIKKWLETHNKCPVTEEPMTLEDLIPLKVNHTVKPRPTAATSVPGLLQILQNEWDALMLETYSLKQQLSAVRQELSQTLYQHDAACRVIARLMKERDEARSLAANGRHVAPRPQGAQSGTEAMDVEGSSVAFPEQVKSEIIEKAKELSVLRKARKVSEELETVESIKAWKQASTNTIHSPSTPGVSCLSIHPQDDARVLTGGVDGSVLVFNLEAKKIMATLSGHTKPITSALFHPTQDLVFSTSKDKTARLWSPGDKGFNCQHVVKCHTDEVTGCALHPTGSYWATSSLDSTWAFIDVASATVIGQQNTLSPCSSLSIHPDGSLLGAGTDNLGIKIWDLKTLKTAATFAHPGPVTSLSFSENGYFLATSAQNTVLLWDLRKLKSFQQLDFPEGSVVSTVQFDHSGTYLAAAGPDIRIFAGKGMEHVSTFSKHTKDVTGVAFGQLARFMVSTSMDRTIKVWSTQEKGKKKK